MRSVHFSPPPRRRPAAAGKRASAIGRWCSVLLLVLGCWTTDDWAAGTWWYPSTGLIGADVCSGIAESDRTGGRGRAYAAGVRVDGEG